MPGAGRVPGWILGLLATSLAVQMTWHVSRPHARQAAETLPPAPRMAVLRLAAFGEDPAAARLVMLYLQGFGARDVDPARLTAWLRASLSLDPLSGYPLFAAARVFAETPDAAASRVVLEFVYQEFMRDPNRRWPWLAHAALLAKHRLKDLPLARRYAAAIDRHTTSADVPLWARQMEIFILEDMDELEAARIMIGGLLAKGEIQDPNELRFLDQRLREIEERIKARVK
jgi:hypothetical protein